jgi:hypothetical protein
MDKLAYYQACVGSCGHILLHAAVNVIASRGFDVGRAYPVPKASG